MSSSKKCYSSFKNLKANNKQSPLAIKEKIRKDYKDKVQYCREMLLNRFRGPVVETELHNTLTEIYKSMFNFSSMENIDEEENKILEEMKNEIIEEEFHWWLEEYEKSQMDNVDWSFLQQENVICPLCQKNNLILENEVLSCPKCKILAKTKNSLAIIKQMIFKSVDKHSNQCNKVGQFTLVPELNESHIYLICDDCSDMQIVI